MSAPTAYLGVILIWTTTPLTIKWSGDGPGFLFGVTGRMVIAVALAMVYLLRVKLPWNRPARRTYLAAGLRIYSVMLCVYWSAQFIPSGWISVIFGLSPIATGVMAAIWLDEQILKPMKLLGMLLGLLGLLVVFSSGLELGTSALYGALGILASTLFHSASAVWVKRLNRDYMACR
ncbi:EamA family transporter [Candidatus Vondammii sp. HM_W22]|uniref:EamA family transporter n=1 Tax=Candidatus Vondammii sp. HM_W22 TaxID=2687299 RepID=UPI002E7B8999|nr:EamA family transporter [Candidatus Vondammii sp. HM_W22]